MRMPPLLADFIHPGVCKPICEKFLTLPPPASAVPVNYGQYPCSASALKARAGAAPPACPRRFQRPVPGEMPCLEIPRIRIGRGDGHCEPSGDRPRNRPHRRHRHAESICLKPFQQGWDAGVGPGLIPHVNSVMALKRLQAFCLQLRRNPSR